jgi:GT2 family glycosyltransferase
MNSDSNLPLISVVIPNYNGSRYLESCLKSLAVQSCRQFEIIVVDNGSTDDSVDIARAVAPDAILLLQKRNLGFAGGANAGIRSSRGNWVAILNNDTEVAQDWVLQCMKAIQGHPEASFLACRVLDYKDRSRVYSAGDCFLRAGIGYRRGQEQPDRKEFLQEREVFSASGCAALYRKTALEETGLFDERFFAYLEDVELGLRLQSRGYHGRYAPLAEVYHHGATTSGGEFSRLSVYLRTRNSLLILLKSIPFAILMRCLPMIIFGQLSWILRVATHGRILDYFKGLGGAFLLAREMIKDRVVARRHWRNSKLQFWQEILNSESLARKEFTAGPGNSVSLFLKWYFLLFRTGNTETHSA